MPGSVDRSSVNLTASYSVVLALRYGTRAFSVNSTATITNTSGGPIDRVEFNTIAARLGGMELRAVEVDGVRRTARVHDQTVIVPLGGILPAGSTAKVRVQYRSTLRSSLAGSNWLFTKVNGIVDAYRWIPWVSRDTPFDRPNHGDPFVTPVSPSVKLRVETDRKLVIASTADRVPCLGRRPDPVVRGHERPRRHGHGRARLPDAIHARRCRPGPLLLPLLGERGHDPRCGRGRRSRLPVAPGWLSRTTSSRSSSQRAATAWSRPA